jgi:hypothetical protein
MERIVILLCGNAHRNRFKLRDCLCYLYKGILCRLRAQSPVIRAFRPNHPTARMLFKLTGHPKAVFFWTAINYLHNAMTPFMQTISIG